MNTSWLSGIYSAIRRVCDRQINSRRRKNERICMHAHALWQIPVPGIHLIQTLMSVTPYLITFRCRTSFGDLFLKDLLSLQGSDCLFLKLAFFFLCKRSFAALSAPYLPSSSFLKSLNIVFSR